MKIEMYYSVSVKEITEKGTCEGLNDTNLCNLLFRHLNKHLNSLTPVTSSCTLEVAYDNQLILRFLGPNITDGVNPEPYCELQWLYDKVKIMMGSFVEGYVASFNIEKEYHIILHNYIRQGLKADLCGDEVIMVTQ